MSALRRARWYKPVGAAWTRMAMTLPTVTRYKIVNGSGADRSGRRLFAERGWQEEEARRLYSAERDGRREKLLSERRRDVTLEDAYRVQRHGVEFRVNDGSRVVGHKVGLTSAAMQRQIGITEPDAGILLDTMAVANGGTVVARDLRAPRVEAELAFRIAADLFGRDLSDEEARAAVGEVCLALEVIDSRFDLEGITLPDSVADNAACARFVLGNARPLLGLDLPGEELTVSVGARTVARGLGREILGDPIRSVVWLARHLAGSASGLSKGDIVLAGAVHASIPLPRGANVSASSAHLGRVLLNVT